MSAISIPRGPITLASLYEPPSEHKHSKSPGLVVVHPGDKAGSFWHTERLDKVFGAAASNVIVPGVTHVDFYDKGPFVGPAVDKVADFIRPI